MRITGLYAVTPSDLTTSELIDRLGGALDAGVRLLQLRRKGLSPENLRREAYLVRALTAACGATLIVNDDLALALEVGADGVHWGREDAPFGDTGELSRQIGDARQRAARAHPGLPFLIGISCYNDFARAAAAAAAGADYLAFGSMFVSSTKPHALPAALSLITRAKQTFKVPIVAIGGITRDNVRAVVDAGADAIAVVSDLFCAPTRDEVAVRARRYQALFSSSPIDTIP